MKSLEPYLLSVTYTQKSRELAGKILVQVLNAYKKLHCGSPEFKTLLAFNINSKVSELSPSDINLALHHISHFADFSAGQAKYLILEFLKKLEDVKAADVVMLLKLMQRCKVTEAAYYDLLVIPILRLQDSFSAEQLISVLDKLAAAGVASKALFKMAMDEYRRFLMVNSGFIMAGEVSSGLSGLIGKEFSSDVSAEMLEQLLIADGQPQSYKTFKELYAESHNPIYNFKQVIELAWSLTVLALNTQGTVDSEAWMLLVKLINRHVRPT